ncbi:MAG: aminotransferase class V-fold PLP-dependent enzyme [Christensenella sp.]|nr:aminotransferase class V-fold PLP-dependent enzyme [Christensenella sp.]
MDAPIIAMLSQLTPQLKTRFCMPGHKGRDGFLPKDINLLDITEVPGADNLYMPEGAIRKSQELYAGSVGAREGFFLVNGSSGGIHAAVLAALQPGDEVIVARDVHLCAVNAFVLAGVKPVFVFPSATSVNVPGVVSVLDMQKAINAHPRAKAVYLTYPNYYGLCADLNGITAIAHRAGMDVICDAAHAAAFDYSPLLPVTPAAAGCDIWVSSLHKTLMAMNQCAVLGVGEAAKITHDQVQSALNMVQTTSPSYLLLGSADYALAKMREQGKKQLALVVNIVEDYMRRIEALGGYRCVLQDVPADTGAYDRDILKLVIDVTDRGVSGFTAARLLQQKGITVETADLSNIVLICTVADTSDDFFRLASALGEIKGSNYHIRRAFSAQDLHSVFCLQPTVDMRSAALAPRRRIPLEKSAGYLSAAAVGAYPPGVPVILPGQEITKEMIDYLMRLKNNGYSLFGENGGIEIACL